MSDRFSEITDKNFCWYITIPMLALISVGIFYNKKIRVDQFFICICIFTLSLFFSTKHPSYTFITFVTCIKLSLVCACYFLLSNKVFDLNVIFKAFIFLAILNFVLLALSIFFDFTFLAHDYNNDNHRWITLLCSPGTLSLVGESIFFYSLFYFISSKKMSVGLLFLLIVSLSIVIFDGSRTGLLVLLLGCFYCMALLAYEGNLYLTFLKRAAIFIVSIVLIIGSIVSFAPPKVVGKFQFRKFIKHSNMVNVAGVAKTDYDRYQLITHAFKIIANNPISGSGGLYSSVMPMKKHPQLKINLYNDKPPVYGQTIHNAYLGTWCDFGIVSFLAYLCLMFSWILKIRLAHFNIRNESNGHIKAMGYNSIFLQFASVLHMVFHPFGNQISYWLLTLVSAAVYWHFATKKVMKFYDTY
jgi:hypothetical protein